MDICTETGIIQVCPSWALFEGSWVVPSAAILGRAIAIYRFTFIRALIAVVIAANEPPRRRGRK